MAFADTVFKERAIRSIGLHDPTENPLFLMFSFHLLHTPMQVPRTYIDQVDSLVAAKGGDPYDSQNRRLYAAMTLCLDTIVRYVGKCVCLHMHVLEHVFA